MIAWPLKVLAELVSVNDIKAINDSSTVCITINTKVIDNTDVSFIFDLFYILICLKMNQKWLKCTSNEHLIKLIMLFFKQLSKRDIDMKI